MSNRQPQPQPFPPELRTASIVPRWSVVWTLTRDTVANHSFYVALYSRKIAQLIKWQGSLGDLLFLALTHDLDETITGDIVSPVKAEIIDPERADAYIRMKMRERLPDTADEIDVIYDRNEDKAFEANSIVKVADRLDALLFLVIECRMGNGVTEPLINSALTRLSLAWEELPCDSVLLQELWHTVVLPAIRLHENKGGTGV